MKARHNAVCKTILIALSLVPFQPAICGKTHGERAPFAKRTAATGNEAAHERLDLQITGFDKIVNSYDTDIIYMQGDTVSVVAEATADVLAAVYVNVSDSTLTLGCKQDLQPAVFPGTLTLHVTAPGLYAVTNNCNMTLTADSLAAGNLTIDNRGAANIKLRCTVSGPVSISNYGNMQLDGALKAGNLEFVNNGACSLWADLRVHTGIELSNRGNLKYEGKAEAFYAEIANSGAGRYDADIKAKHTEMSISGNARGNVSIKGDKVNVKCSGAANMNMALECETLSVSSNGNARLKVSGTADYVEFTGKGAANIDTSGLNKF